MYRYDFHIKLFRKLQFFSIFFLRFNASDTFIGTGIAVVIQLRTEGTTGNYSRDYLAA